MSVTLTDKEYHELKASIFVAKSGFIAIRRALYDGNHSKALDIAEALHNLPEAGGNNDSLNNFTKRSVSELVVTHKDLRQLFDRHIAILDS